MQILRLTDEYKEHWNNFIKINAADGGLLHSWQWGEFQKDLDSKVFRLGLINGEGQLQAAALIVRTELPFEYNYLYCPRGPVINVLKIGDLKSLFAEIRNIAREEKSFLVRIDPPWLSSNEKMLVDSDFRKADSEVQPKCALMIDITKSEEQLLSEMKPKVRYNVGLAKRHGVTIRISDQISDIEPFWQLTKQTAARDRFAPHAKEHYKKMFKILSVDGLIKLFIAEHDNKIIAINMVSFFGSVSTYLHGASSDIYRDVMAPFLLQWESILEAKKQGMKYYDFGGVNGKTFHNEKWAGITRFKTGFSPATPPVEYVGSFEQVINPVVYSVYKFVKQIRG